MRPQAVIYATLSINAALFVINLLVAIPSGSRAVLSQAIYSITDLAGAGLILWGYYASQREPTPDHPFGFGKERFFWAFMASFIAFTVAGFIVLITGIERIYSPTTISNPFGGVIVVGISLVASVAGVLVALRELRRSRETVQTLMESAHLGVKTIFFQDLVSIGASAVAFVGIGLVAVLHIDIADGIAACLVGGLLIAGGFVISAESREFLIGKSIPPQVARQILAFVERDPRIRRVRSLQSMMLGPDDAIIALRVNFIDELTTDHLEREVDLIAAGLRVEFPAIRHIIIEPES